MTALTACGPGFEGSTDLTLRVGLSGAPSGLDPHLQNESLAGTVLGNIFETLVSYDSSMTIQLTLAERWENPDQLRWRFHLRRGVVFHDGSSFDADDVVESFSRARGIEGTRAAAYLTMVARIEAVDPYTLDVVTSQPDPALLARLTKVPIVATGAPAVITRPIGTGPFRYAGPSNDGGVALEAFAEYWGAAPTLRRVVFSSIEDQDARVRALLAGEVDLVTDLRAGFPERVESARGFRVETSTALEVAYLQLRPDAAPFDDIRVRRAIHIGLDREALVEAILSGHGTPVGQMANPNLFGYADGLDPPPRDLRFARELLREAGAGALAPVVLEHRDNVDSAPLVRQLSEIGFDVEVVTRPWNEMYPRLVGGDIAMYLGRWNSTIGDTSELFDAKVHTPDPTRGYGDSNTFGYSNPELDRLIEEAAQSLDVLERRQVLSRCMWLLMDDCVLIPLWAGESMYGVSELVEWRPRLDGLVLAASAKKKGAPMGGSS